MSPGVVGHGQEIIALNNGYSVQELWTMFWLSRRGSGQGEVADTALVVYPFDTIDQRSSFQSHPAHIGANPGVAYHAPD